MYVCMHGSKCVVCMYVRVTFFLFFIFKLFTFTGTASGTT
jgi:hypothetical protein